MVNILTDHIFRLTDQKDLNKEYLTHYSDLSPDSGPVSYVHMLQSTKWSL